MFSSAKPAKTLAMFHDLLREPWTNMWNSLQLFSVCAIEIHCRERLYRSELIG